MKLSIKLNQQFRSFEQGSTFTFEGNLLFLLSGINGSGKSQLLDIIKGRDRNNSAIHINRTINFNDTLIEDHQIQLKTFRELNSIGDLNNDSNQSHTNQKNQVWSNYSSYRLNPLDDNIRMYSGAAKNIKQKLINKYGQAAFDAGLSREEVFLSVAVDDWMPDDVFSASVVEKFKKYATRSAMNNTQGVAPWVELNKLFELLNFNYRFEDDFQIDHDSLELTKLVYLYPLTDHGIDTDSPFSLIDLSDGEKCIISIAYASINSPNDLKLLLLDEVDALLNPSLTQGLFKVIEDLFVNKGITTILTTHSPTTLTLAPKDLAMFYEIFPRRITNDRLKANLIPDEYEEFKLAHERFYNEIEDQGTRLEKLEREKNVLEQIIANNSKAVIFVEGPTDKQILEAAWDKLYPEIEMPFYIPNVDAGNNAKDVKFKLENASSFQNQHGVIGVLDFDEEGYNNWNGIKHFDDNIEMDPYKCLSKSILAQKVHIMLLPLNSNDVIKKQLFDSNGVHFKSKTRFYIELMFYGIDSAIDAAYFEKVDVPGGTQIQLKGNKARFAKAVENFNGNAFTNFKILFDGIKSKIV